jgi:hypothetical protein
MGVTVSDYGDNQAVGRLLASIVPLSRIIEKKRNAFVPSQAGNRQIRNAHRFRLLMLFLFRGLLKKRGTRSFLRRLDIGK